MELEVIKDRLAHIPSSDYPAVGKSFVHLLDTLATGAPRGSFYNKQAEIVKAIWDVHETTFNIDRGLYGIMLAFPGVMDYSKQIGMDLLLDNPFNGVSFLTVGQEKKLLQHLIDSMPITRQLKTFGRFADARINNSRTRKLILRSILNDKELVWHAVKYRGKLRKALVHAWGQRMSSILQSILNKWGERESLTSKEMNIIYSTIDRHLVDGMIVQTTNELLETIRFILGSDVVENPILKAYIDANEDPEKLSALPPEVAEGKRSVFHKDISPADVLKKTAKKATVGQKISMQKAAKKAGVEMEFDPSKYDAVRLYVYAYEMGMTDEIKDVLKVKAQEAAEKLPIAWDNVSIIVDNSKSMEGHGTQKMRPIAVAMAMRDMLMASAKEGSKVFGGHHELPIPVGDTSIASAVINAALMEPDAIFIITDGYENAPAGRTAEVIDRMRKMGNDTPIMQLTPVFSAEAYGTRELSEYVPVMPVKGPESLGIGMVKTMLEVDFERGIQALANVTNRSVPLLEAPGEV